MSHIVSIKTEVRDPVAVAAACRRLGLPEPVHGTAKLFEGEATGLLVRLPGWLYPVVVRHRHRRRSQFDNYDGSLGPAGAPRPLHAGLRRREGQAGGPEEGLLRQRAAARRRQHPAPDRRGPLSHAPHRPPARPGPLPSRPIHDPQIGEIPMPRIIEVTVSPRGEATVQTKGYTGGDCLAASKFLEQALGVSAADAQDRRVLPGPARRPGPHAVPVIAAHRHPRPEEPCDARRRRARPRPWRSSRDRRGDPRRAGRGDRRLPRLPLARGGRPAQPRLPGRRPLASWRRTASRAVDLAALVSRTLRRVAERRLAAEGWDDRQVQAPDRAGARQPRRLARAS